MYCTDVLVTLGLFGALIVIWRQGNRASCTCRYAPGYCAQRRAFFNSPEFLRHFETTRIGEFCRAMVLFQKLAQNIGKLY